ncbi:MAG: hypothetical protein K1X78_08345 [Verrucomicrobiaceae bacterium]|nr:hypothetical protein [Verrucomicrobiaceae bacterium]
MPQPSIAQSAGSAEATAAMPVSHTAAGANEHRVAFIMFGVTVVVCAAFIAMIVTEVL